ncbi:aspartyl protease family protein [Actinomadura sp. KC216]|uniref:aspartyl protease family protein n=1 Tax=Actinomadura sp. KC216 TaxID=2530370 RepID=UPI001A9EB41C|nr:aspartyl protease family protein [Actinomadura sp. KC216]
MPQIAADIGGREESTVHEEGITQGLERRKFLQRAGLAAAVGATLPLLGTGGASALAAVPSSAGDPDKLFKDGHFKRAEQGYRRLLTKDADNAHAAAQIGYIALLSNRFADAERFLKRAVTLKPDDEFSLYQLADCYVRQDRLREAVPWLRKTENTTHAAYATLYEHIKGTPWRVDGPQSTRVPLLGIDPLPHLQVSINGRPPTTFLLDTGATTAGFSMDVAADAGLTAISESRAKIEDKEYVMYHGIAESVRVGDIEIRNAPVHWNDAVRPKLPDDSVPQGTLGTVLFYHFLTTMDYGHEQFVLRRKTEAGLRRFRAQAARLKGDVLPLWLAKDHFPCTLGSLNDFGPRVVTFDTGGPGRGIGTSIDFAERAGVELGEPEESRGGVRYPIAPERSSLGKATRRRVKGYANENPKVGAGMKFDTIANFTHEFFESFAITFDYTHMNLYITGDSMDPDAR